MKVMKEIPMAGLSRIFTKCRQGTLWRSQVIANETNSKSNSTRPSSNQLNACSTVEPIISNALNGSQQQSRIGGSFASPSSPVSENLSAVQKVEFQTQAALNSLFCSCDTENLPIFMGHNFSGFH